MPSFSSTIPFTISLSIFVCFLPEVLFCTTSRSSCTLFTIQNHFLRISDECSPESYRCLVGTVIPSSSFTHSLTRSVHGWCLSTNRVCESLSIHLVRFLPGRQINVPCFWKTPPSVLEVDPSRLLSSLKH